MIDLKMQAVHSQQLHTQHDPATEVAEGWRIAARGDTDRIPGGVSMKQQDTHHRFHSTAKVLTEG